MSIYYRALPRILNYLWTQTNFAFSSLFFPVFCLHPSRTQSARICRCTSVSCATKTTSEAFGWWTMRSLLRDATCLADDQGSMNRVPWLPITHLETLAAKSEGSCRRKKTPVPSISKITTKSYTTKALTGQGLQINCCNLIYQYKLAHSTSLIRFLSKMLDQYYEFNKTKNKGKY